MRKPLLLISVLIFSVATAAAATNEPRHPLSQIYPVDEALNMSDRAIFNVSELRLRNGLQIDGTSIQDPGNVNILEWDAANNEWDVRNSDLNLNGNSINGFFSSACPDGQMIDQINADGSYGCASVVGETANLYVNETGDNLTGDLDMNGNRITNITSQGPGDAVNKSYVDNNDDTLADDQDFADVLGQDNSAGSFNVDMNGQDILNVNEISNGSNSVGFGSSIDLKGNNIVNPGNTDGVDLDNPGNGISISGSQYVIPTGAIADDELSDTSRLTINGIDLTDSMNASGNTIHMVGPATHQYDAVNKSYVDDNDDTISDDQNLQDVLGQGNSAGDFNIDMSQEDLKRLRRVQFADNNGDAARFNITESGGDLQLLYNGNQRLNVLKSGGIEVRNGNIEMQNSNFLQGRDADGNLVNLIGQTSNAATLIGTSGGTDSGSGSGDVRININREFQVRDTAGGTPHPTRFQVSHGAREVDIGLDGGTNLDLNSNNITNIDRIKLENGGRIYEPSSGEIGFRAGGTRYMNIGNQGQVEIYSGLDMAVNPISRVTSISGTSNDFVISGRGGVDDQISLRSSHTGTDMLEFANTGPLDIRNPVTGNDIIRMNASGGSSVAVPNGDLDMSGNRIVSIGSGGTEFDSSGNLIMQNDGNYLMVNGVQFGTWGGGSAQIRGATTSRGVRLQAGGGSNILVADGSNMNVRIPNGNLSLENNTITDIASPDDPFDAANKQYVDSSDNTVSDDQNLQDVLGQGNSAGDFNIDMSQEDLKRLRRVQFADNNGDAARFNITESGGDLQLLYNGNQRLNVLKSGGIEVRNGGLSLNQNPVLDPGEVDGVNISDPGNAIVISGNQYAVASGGIGSDELASGAVTASGTELGSSVAGNQLSLSSGALAVDEGSGSGLDADTLDGVQLANINWGDVAMAQGDVDVADLDPATTSLDMNGNQVQNVVSNSAGDAVNKSYVDDSDNTISDDQNLEDVLGQGNSTGSFDINMNGNDLLTGGGTVSVVDSTNNQDVARFDEGGNVEIPNGNFRVTGGTSSTRVSITGAQGKSLTIEGNVESYSQLSADAGVISGPSARSIAIQINSNSVEDKFAVTDDDGDEHFNVESGGEVNIPSGNLNMNNNNINEVASIDGGGNDISVDDSVEMNGNQVQGAGKVGVGTSSPQEDLDVDGTASVSNSGTTMEVNSNGDMVVTLGSG